MFGFSKKNWPLLVFPLLLIACQGHKPQPREGISRAVHDPRPYRILTNREPTLLSLEEMITMVKNPAKAQASFEKAEQLFASPFINNSQYFQHGPPKPLIYEKIGPALRVSTWNLEKSIRTADVANMLTSLEGLQSQLRPEVLTNKEQYEEALRQRNILAQTDILLLQEMDLGHCRSGYIFAAKHLAQKLGMNYVYAPQQLEIDPVYLGLKDFKSPNGDTLEPCPASEHHLESYKGVFGVAVLSRFPIKRVQAFQLDNKPYDWYHSEMEQPDIVENTRRGASEELFHFRPVREIKYGGRGFTRVDLHVPQVPHETVSVINVHLEIKTTPHQRAEQVREILSYIKDIKNPVIMAGDFNSASRDVSATSFTRLTSRTASDPTFLFSTGLFLANITGINQLRAGLNFAKNIRDPLAIDVPVIFPNKSRELFQSIKEHRFDDGGAFDFRGDRRHSSYRASGVLSNSNQRFQSKGYTYTFELPRTIGPFGKERLDWIFVKSFLTKPNERKGPYQLAPQFGETLEALNTFTKERYSDHHPISVLLPLEEPSKE